MAEKKTDLDRLANSARGAGKALEDQQGAFEAERQAELGLIRAVLQTIAPALPVLVHRLDGYGVAGEGAAIGAALELEGGRTKIWIVATGKDRDIPVFADIAGADPRVLTPLDPEDVADGWAVEDIVRALAQLFERQIIGRKTSTESARRSAEKLVALAKLLDF